MNTLPQQITPDLLKLDTQALLAAFGAGNPTPGSGSAAALNGALACELIATSAQLTMAKTDAVRRKQESQYVLAQVSAKRPVLKASCSRTRMPSLR
jgi:formiminotetrahydrofolate cyclodeaminase